MPDMTEFFDFTTDTGPWATRHASYAAGEHALHLWRADWVRTEGQLVTESVRVFAATFSRRTFCYDFSGLRT